MRLVGPDRAPLKEVLGGQYNYREGGGKCCGKALKGQMHHQKDLGSK